MSLPLVCDLCGALIGDDDVVHEPCWAGCHNAGRHIIYRTDCDCDIVACLNCCNGCNQ